MSSPRVVVSANAAPGVGGQGVCLANTLHGLESEYRLALFAAAPAAAFETTVVPGSRIGRAVAAVPGLRRRRDWIVRADDTAFDRHVARRLPRAELFHGTTGQSLASIRAAHRLGMPAVLDVITLHVRDFADVMTRSCRRFGVHPPIGGWLARRTEAEYGEADLVRAVSSLSRATLVAGGVPERRIVTTLPPFDLARFPPAHVEQDPFCIGYAGALEPWKGFDYLVEAFESLAFRDARLALWGGAGSRAVTRWLGQRMAREPRIRARPYSPSHEEYQRVYGSMSVLVHPSLSDGFALVVGEAMASGVPVIVTDRTGAAELVRDGHNGYVVPAADSGAIRERLEHLAARPALLREMGAAARETMAALTLDRFRATLLPRLEELLRDAGERSLS